MNDWRTLLVDAIKTEAESMLAGGRARAPEVANNVIELHGDLVHMGASELARVWIVDKARSVLKATVATANGEKQLTFDGLDESVVRLLPRCIAIPENATESEFTFIPIEVAAPDQLALGIAYLERCIERDQARVEALRVYLDWRKSRA